MFLAPSSYDSLLNLSVLEDMGITFERVFISLVHNSLSVFINSCQSMISTNMA
jgi:hypothetical protein